MHLLKSRGWSFAQPSVSHEAVEAQHVSAVAQRLSARIMSQLSKNFHCIPILCLTSGCLTQSIGYIGRKCLIWSSSTSLSDSLRSVPAPAALVLKTAYLYILATSAQGGSRRYLSFTQFGKLATSSQLHAEASGTTIR